MFEDVLAAWRMRHAVRDDAGSVVIDLRGGRGAVVRRADAKRLVSVVTTDDAAHPSPGLRGWLERRQAKRSAILVVPDRQTGVKIALRWGLDPQRFRLGAELDPAANGRSTMPPWHLAG